MHDLFRELAQEDYAEKIYTDADIAMLVRTEALTPQDYQEITGKDYVA